MGGVDGFNASECSEKGLQTERLEGSLPCASYGWDCCRVLLGDHLQGKKEKESPRGAPSTDSKRVKQRIERTSWSHLLATMHHTSN